MRVLQNLPAFATELVLWTMTLSIPVATLTYEYLSLSSQRGTHARHVAFCSFGFIANRLLSSSLLVILYVFCFVY